MGGTYEFACSCLNRHSLSKCRRYYSRKSEKETKKNRKTMEGELLGSRARGQSCKTTVTFRFPVKQYSRVDKPSDSSANRHHQLDDHRCWSQ